MLSAQGAVWTTFNGYECPRWFASSLQEAIPEHSFRRTAHMQQVQQEVITIRENVGFIEMSPLTKFTVCGSGAAVWVDRIMANKLPRVGRMTLSVVCNERGGIDGEYTIVRHAENDFYLVSTPNAAADWHVLTRKILR